MQCKELEFVLAHDDLGALSAEAREHLADCDACRDLFADFSAIVTAAKHIPAEVNPPERVWVAVRAQLEAEGIIREPEVVAIAPEAPWWTGFQQFFRPRVLATVLGALLVSSGAVYFVQRHQGVTSNPTQVADTSKPSTPDTAKAVQPVAAPDRAALKPQGSRNHSGRAGAPAQPHESHLDLRPSPSEDANFNFSNTAMVLSDTEGALPSRSKADNAMVDAALRQNLRTLNEFIAECEARLKQNPQDQLTREYLNTAYQQKAELLSAMMDSGRSEN
jgi:hypothetical protein